MDWLDKTINNYEEKSKATKEEKQQALQAHQQDMELKRKAADECIKKIYPVLFDIRRGLEKKGKYPVKTDNPSFIDANTGQQFLESAILLVRNRPLAPSEKINNLVKANSPFIQFKADYMKEVIIIETSIHSCDRQTEQSPYDKITPEFIEGKVKAFVQKVFAA